VKLISALFKAVLGILSKFFGSFSWSPPPWMAFLRHLSSNIKSLISRFTAAARSLIKKPPTPAKEAKPAAEKKRGINFKRLGATLAVVFIIFTLLMWYAAYRRGLIRVTGTVPELTKLEDVLKPDPVRVLFSGSAARLDLIGKTLTQGISIIPAIEGEWTWVKDNTLLFKPKADWQPGTGYTVRMDKSLFPDHVKLATHSYSFETPRFGAELTSAEFYQDPEDPKIKKVIATIRFTHPVDSVDFEKRIKLERADQKTGILGIGGKGYPFTVSYDKYKGEAYIQSKPLEIPEKDTSLSIAVGSGIRAERGGPGTPKPIEKQVTIPGKFTMLRIDSAELSLVRNERYEPEQVLVVNTTAGVSEAEIVKNLSVFVLPKDLPPVQKQEAKKDYQWSEWSDPSKIGPEILERSSPVKLTSLPRDREYAELHSFKYSVPPGRYLYIKLNKNIKSFGGYFLAKEFDTIQRVPDLPQEIGIMADGSILSLHGEKRISVFARDIEAVRFELGRVVPDDINHLVTQTRGDIKSPEFLNYEFNEDNISEHFSEIRIFGQGEQGKAQYTTFDFSRYLKTEKETNRGMFFLRVESWDPKTKKTTGKKDKRLILITDLGVLVKDNADQTHDVFVQSIQTGHPVSGARVDILGKNGVSVFGTNTDVEGRTRFPKLTDFNHEKAPTVYLVRKGSDISFLPYERSERKLNYSRFDIGGVVTEGAADRLDAYLFSDRGIYRPGDEFHIGIIVKSANWTRAFAGIPLEASIMDSRGLEVKRQKISLTASGFEEVQYQTEDTSPTGKYTTNLYIIKDNKRGTLLGSASVRVEEFLPDRLKISTKLSQERREGWVAPSGLKGMVNLMNLYGTPAVNHRIAAEVTLAPASPSFKQYQDYTFFDPAKAEKSFAESLSDAATNEKGDAEIDLNLGRFDKATYRLTFAAEGYELEGGRSVGSTSTVLVSPLLYLVGYKPDGDLTYIHKGSSRTVDLIAIDPSLKKIAVKGLKAQIIEERYVSVLTKQSSGVYKYQSVKREIPVSTTDLSLSEQGMKFRLPTANPGDFLLLVQDDKKTELARAAFSVAGVGNLTRNLEKNAELLIKLNKSDYAPGEEIELQIRAPYTGAGVITIERDKVYATKWFKTTATNSVQKIRVPVTFEGNGYVNVSFVRGLDSKEIFMSPLSYGVMPFSVSRERRTIKIDIDTPELARPGEPFKIRYKGNKAGKAVVYAVDEGILQVAKYKTPDPLEHFFRKRALEVKTAQILDLIMPENSIVRMLSAAGGDEGGRGLGQNLNPFKRKRDKPVVYWSGIVPIDQTMRELIYRVPDYFNGTIRVMAVAVAPDAIGANQKRSAVRGHFVLSPNVPTFVAPGDEFIVTVSVANNVEGSGKDAAVNLDLATSEHLEVLDKGQRSLKIAEGREESASFKIKAKDILGSARFTFTASLGNKKTAYSVEASVRPPVPYMTDIKSGFFKSGKEDIEVKRTMHPEFRTLDASASSIPLGLAHGLVAYLEKFPYLCTEQLVSQAFPAIVLKNRPEFGYTHKKAGENLEKTISVLRSRQNADGAFGFWAANSHVSEYASVYAMHFLTEAKERGYAVPQELVSRGNRYLNSLSFGPVKTLSQARIQAYAIYVLTRNGEVTTNFVDTLRDQLDKTKETKKWKKDLTASYLAATYKMLKLDSKAEDLISGMKMGHPVDPDYDNFYDSLAHDSQHLYILGKHFPERFKKFSEGDIICMQCIVNGISNNSFNTITSAYAILAMDAYAETVGEKAVADIRFKEILEKGMKELTKPKGLFPKVAFSGEAKKMRIESGSGYPTFWQVTMAGFDKSLPTKEIKEGLEVQREYRDLKGNVITSTALGAEIEVHFKMRSVKSGYHSNVAIVDLLPGGFEVVLEKSRPASKPEEQQAQPQEQPTQRQEQGEGDEREGEGEGEAVNEHHDGGPRWISPIGTDASTWQPDFVDIREDRVVLFGSVGSSAQEFVYRIKATNKGKYVIPPAFAESMYDRAVRARTLSGTMVVEEKKKEDNKQQVKGK
jgi:alpha-2-macroglobulin